MTIKWSDTPIVREPASKRIGWEDGDVLKIERREDVAKDRAKKWEAVQKFDPNQPRDKEGQWAKVGGRGELVYNPDSKFIEEVKTKIEERLRNVQWAAIREERGAGNLDPNQRSDQEVEALKVAMTERYQRMLKQAVPVIRIPSEVVPSILRDERFRTQHEAGVQAIGIFAPDWRKEIEAKMFGPSKWPPTYGMFVEDFNQARGSQYGDVFFVLKDSILDRTTVGAGDSLGDVEYKTRAPRPYKQLDWVAVGNNRMSAQTVDDVSPYVEAQFHGGVMLEDVKEVAVPHRVYKKWQKDGTLQRFQDQHQIAVRVIAPGQHKARVS